MSSGAKGRARPDRGRRWGLTRLTVIAGALLALLVGLAFTVLLLAIQDMRASASDARAFRNTIIHADNLEQLVTDLESGQRGFVITKEQEFLEPWQQAREAFPAQAAEFRDSAVTPDERRFAAEITQDIGNFIDNYSIPLIRAVERGDPSASSLETTQSGKDRVDALRADLNGYNADARDQLLSRQDTADKNSERAVAAASAGIAGSTVLIIGFTAYQSRAIVRPVRRAADVAGRLARGDLGVRMPTNGPAEIGALGASFNTMAASLQESRRRADTAGRRLRLLYDAGVLVGTGLDMKATARELAQVAVPRFADFATVDLRVAVLTGEELPNGSDAQAERVAVGGVTADHPLHPVGARTSLDLALPDARVESDLRTAGTTAWAEDADHAARILDYGIHSLIHAPLLSRGMRIGEVRFWRSRPGEPFDEDDLLLAEEMAAKGAVCDRQRPPLRPRARDRADPPAQPAAAAAARARPRVEVASRYLPAGRQAGVGGDWFDVIPLSGTRVALVVGRRGRPRPARLRDDGPAAHRGPHAGRRRPAAGRAAHPPRRPGHPARPATSRPATARAARRRRRPRRHLPVRGLRPDLPALLAGQRRPPAARAGHARRRGQ